MEFKLQDKTPVQLNYHSVRKPLYAKFKGHIEILYNKGWIINSSSWYSLSVVSWEKEMAHYACAVTCQLNRKTTPDRDLPKIQNILKNLRGNQYVSILDQGKA